LKRKLGLEVFVPPEQSKLNVAMGIHINKLLGFEDTMPLYNLLEPTYIVYPYMRNFVEDTGAPAVAAEHEEEEEGEHEEEEEGEHEEDLSPVAQTGGAEPQPIKGLLVTSATLDSLDKPPSFPASTLPHSYASIGQYILAGKREGIAAPFKIFQEDKTVDLSTYKLYSAFDAGVDVGKGFTSPPSDGKLYEITLIDDTEPMEDESVTKTKVTTTGTFLPTKKNTLEGVVTIPLGNTIYKLRDAVTQEGVKLDWDNAIFTEDEAKFLNDLNIRVYMLEKIYGEESWREELKHFLLALVQTDCFKDERLLSHRKCMNARRFINDIFMYFLQNNTLLSGLEETETKMAADKDKRDKNDALATIKGLSSELTDMAGQLQRLKDATGTPNTGDPEKNAEKLQNSPIGTVVKLTGQISGRGTLASRHTGGGMAFPVGTMPLIRDAFNPKSFSFHVMVINKSSGDYTRGLVEVEANGEADALQRLKEKLERLKEDYPGFIIVA